MSQAAAPYLTDTDRDRLRAEAHALAFVLGLAEAERPEACDKLEAAALALPAWLRAVRKELTAAPAVGLPALWRVLDRPELDKEALALKAAGVDLASLQSMDPAKARAAYNATLADTQRAGMLACARTAAGMLAQMEAAPTEAARRELVLDAVRELTRPQAEGDAPLADAWQAHLTRLAAPVAKDNEVLRLQSIRGTWAAWFNDWLGPRAGLEPGQTFILAGASETGKTSLAALLAVDALAVGCPVLFWQLELGREETLEHLQAQRPELSGPDGKRWWETPFWNRARNPLPPDWADLLTVPRWPAPEVGAIQAAMLNQARQADRARRADKPSHDCKGLVIVDYAQLLTLDDAGPSKAQHEVLCTGVSRLAKAAGESGACLLLLSQMNKGDQANGTATGTALAGADLQRMAHRVVFLQKAAADGKACSNINPEPDFQTGKGEARLLTWRKARGIRYDGERRPERARIIWDGGKSRAFHGGDVVPVKKGWKE